MSLAERCDEIVELIDRVLADAVATAGGDESEPADVHRVRPVHQLVTA